MIGATRAALRAGTRHATSVADVYDALTSDRPYRKAMSPFDAKEILVKGSGTDFDPRVIDAFLDLFKRGEMEVAAVQL